MVNTSTFFRQFINQINFWIKNWGIVYTIKYYKQMRLHCTRYLCGHPLKSNTMSIGLTKDGWPKKLLFLKPFADSNSIALLKFCLTILNFSRGWVLLKQDWDKVLPNYKVITDKPKGNFIIPSGVINKFVKEFNLKLEQPSFKKSDIYLSSKAGPHGPATLTSQNSLLLYNYPEMQAIFNLTDEEGQEFFMSSYRYAWENNLKPTKVNSKGVETIFRHKGKISFIKDPEAKLRLIAISDYYTQLYLKPIHDKILKLLRKIKTDRTFTQDPNNCWDLTNNESFWSLDLSSATDRFPIELQKRLLARIFHMELANSWQWLLHNRVFVTPEGDSITYNTGQPMGTYSSWAVFTLTHHLVVYYCSQLHGIHNFNQYMILGDDIVIKNDAIAKTYIKVMNSLGVDISLNKTHVSVDTYEFAKRWIRPKDKWELTGLPVKGIFSNYNNPFIVFTILYDYFKIKENNYFSKLTLVNLVVKLYYKLSIPSLTKKGTFNKVNGKLLYQYLSINRKTYNKLQNYSLALDINFGIFSYEKLRRLFCNLITNDNYVIPDGKVALLEYKRILLSGMANVVGNMNKNILMLPSEFLDRFPEQDKNNLAVHPLFISVYNCLNKMWDKVMIYKDQEDLCLHSLSKEISDLNLDSIFNKDRNKIQSLLLIGNILNLGIQRVNKTTEIYYGSSWTESTFTSPTDLLYQTQKNFNLDEFDKVFEGKWTKPRSANDYISMWENL